MDLYHSDIRMAMETDPFPSPTGRSCPWTGLFFCKVLLQNIQQDLKEAYLFKDPADGLHKVFCYKVECLGPLGPDEKHQVDKLYARHFLTEEAAVRYLAKEFPNSERKLFHTYMVSKTLNSRMIECINILSSTDFAGLISLLSISNE